MARTKQRSSRSKNNNRRTTRPKGPKAAFIRSSDERGGGSQFFSLQDGEKFEGYALFNPDPGEEDNPGYIEFKQHWDVQRGTYVPCWGAKNGCIFCKAGMRPSDRALAAFLVVSMNGEKLDEPEVKIFRMNWGMIEEWADTLQEDGETLGQRIRIKCLDHGDGEYSTKFYDGKKLTKKDLKSAVEDIPELEDIVQGQLDRALENLRIEDVLEADDDEDDDEDEEETPKNKTRGRGRPKKVVEEDEEDEDEEDDEEADEEDEDEEDEESDEDEEDEDEEDEEEDEDEEEGGSDEEDSIAGEYTVVSSNESEMTFTLKELDSDLYISEEMSDDIDFDDFKKGDKVTVSAVKDEDGDWVATELTKAKAKRGRGRPKGSKNKK